MAGDAAPCGLYLVLPDDWENETFFMTLRDLFRALNASSYSKNNHVIELRHENTQNDPLFVEKAVALATFARSRGMVFVVANDTTLAKQCSADGVMLSDATGIKQARAAMGDDAIIGVRCGLSKQAAEAALMQGADYISFSDAARGYVDPEVIRWWVDKTNIPCLAEGRYTSEDCPFYVQAGAYLIEASHYIWGHEGGVMQGVVDMNHAIDRAAGRDHKNKTSIQ